MIQRKQYDYEIMKILGLLFVVVGHATRFYVGDGVFKPINESLVLDYFSRYLYTFHMPMFMFVSGCVYSYLKVNRNKYTQFKPFIINKFRRLMIPYFLVGLFFVYPVLRILNLNDSNVFRYLKSNLIVSTDSRHLWFLYALFVIYGVFFLFEKFIKKSPIWLNIFIFRRCKIVCVPRFGA